MLIRSRICVQTWTGVLAFAATSLVCTAVSRAEQAWYAALGPNMQAAFSALMEKPTTANLQAVRGLLGADRTYAPYSDDLTQLNKLLHEGKDREVIALFVKSQPNLLLCPLAHRLAAEAAAKIGDKNSAAAEMVFATRCVDGILASGDGSESRPFLIARLSDEGDVLKAAFNTRIQSQGLVFHGDLRHDRVIADDGNTYWFDVSMPVDHAVAAPVQAPVAAGLGGPSAPAAEAADDRSAALPQDVPASRDSLAGAKALIQRGLDAYRAGRNDEALSALNDAIARDPRNASIHVDRGNVWYVQREYEPAIADFSEAVLLDPGCAAAYSNRAFAWSALGDQDQAITDFNAAIRLQANFGRAYNGRGCAFQAKGMIDTAIADFTEAIRLNPNYAAAYENRSSAYAKKGKQALADADAAKASKLRGVKATPAAPANLAEKTAGN
ncbi:MAG: tetratricopeptide repeat protein [Thermoguttaceae bacterium]